jgi:hypothetical protein
MYQRLFLKSNAQDQQRRAVCAPLADRALPVPIPVSASAMPTRDDRRIAQLEVALPADSADVEPTVVTVAF